MGKGIQTRSKSGASLFKNGPRNDWLKHQGIERKNLQLGKRVRQKTRHYIPGEVAPYIDNFMLNGVLRQGLNPGTHYTHAVRITYTGGRAGDFALANNIAGLPGTPNGYVWHHFHDWLPPIVHGGNGSGMMYLMTVADHGVFHYGGVAQMEAHFGLPYRP